LSFFKHIFPLKVTRTSEQHIDIANDTMCEDLRRSKRQRKETSYGDDFILILLEMNDYIFQKLLVFLMQNIRTRPLELKLIPLRKITLGL